MSIIGQPSLFGVTAVAPGVTDLAGLLLAGATTATRSGGAQLTVAVDHPWRASVLVLECARRGLAATNVSTPDQRIAVRTAHSPLLVALIGWWADGPDSRGLLLDGQPLRLWAEAAGAFERPGVYRLATGLTEEADRRRVARALDAVGLAGEIVGAGRGCSYRISGKRRLARLAELVGDPPNRAPADIWPS